MDDTEIETENDFDGFQDKEDAEELYYEKWFEDMGNYSWVK